MRLSQLGAIGSFDVVRDGDVAALGLLSHDGPAMLVAAIAEDGACAKVRTGGTSEETIPSTKTAMAAIRVVIGYLRESLVSHILFSNFNFGTLF